YVVSPTLFSQFHSGLLGAFMRFGTLMFAAAAVTLAMASTAHADTVVQNFYTGSFSVGAGGGYDAGFDVNGFDSSLGTLTSVDVTLDGKYNVTASSNANEQVQFEILTGFGGETLASVTEPVETSNE